MVLYSKDWRNRQARILIWWRNNIRWKSSHGVNPCCHDCNHIRKRDSELKSIAKSLFGITFATIYRLVAESAWIKSKWTRCPKCHKLVARPIAAGCCKECNRALWHAKMKDPLFVIFNRNRSLRLHEKIRQCPRLKQKRYEQWRAWYDAKKMAGTHLDHKHRRKAMESNARISGEVITRPKAGMCHYCKKKIAGKKLHLDHVVPLSRGGAHASYNIVVACSECNIRKHAKMPNLWTPNGQLEMVLNHV